MGASVSFWTTEADRELLKRVCEARGENLSSFIRRAIKKELASLNFYSDFDKKSLGISTKGAGER